MKKFIANLNRYSNIHYTKVGNSGLKLPKLTLGFWHNFGNETPFEKVEEMVLTAFNQGITHFDLANNYGQPAGSAEVNLGKILKKHLMPYRDQIIISTKAGYTMWDGPYGDWGSRKYLLASLDQSLARLGLKYVDIFYHHRFDPNTPLEETMGALVDAIRIGKALYVGLSNYPVDKLKLAIKILKSHGVQPVLFQPKFNLLNRNPKVEGHFDLCKQEGLGVIPFSIFAQGLLTGKYLEKIPKNSRMANPNNRFLTKDNLDAKTSAKLSKVNQLAMKYKVSMSYLALQYVLSHEAIPTALIGISSVKQLLEIIELSKMPPLTQKIVKELEQAVE